MILRHSEPTVNVGPIDVHTDHRGDPPEVAVFRELAESRRRLDHSAIRHLTAELRRLGWMCVPILPRGEFAGRAGR